MLIKFSDWMVPSTRLQGEFRGKVVDNSDPNQRARVRVEIEGLLKGSKEKLPWIYSKAATTIGGSSQSGSLHVPEVGSYVTVIFPYGSIYQGFYTGYSLNSTSNVSELTDDYPNTVGSTDTCGNTTRINKKQGTFEYLFRGKDLPETVSEDSESTVDLGPVKVKIKMDKSGNVVIEATGDFNLTVSGKTTIKSTGDLDISSDGNTKLSAKGKVDIQSGGDTSINSSGKISISASGAADIKSSGSMSINSSGSVKISGSSVSIN